jgi:hypothetical protein
VNLSLLSLLSLLSSSSSSSQPLCVARIRFAEVAIACRLLA